jgi:hypothetical protein
MVNATRMAAAVATLVLLTGCQARVAATTGGTGSRLDGPVLRPGYPASFIGSALDSCGPRSRLPRRLCQGLDVFSAATGAPERSLSGQKDAFSPEVLEHPHVVYYFTVGQGSDCDKLLRVPYGGSRPTLVRRFTRVALTSFAVSADGMMLAYQTARGTASGACSAQGRSLLTVVNLATGARHVIAGAPAIFDMAWSKRGRQLAIEYPRGTYAISAIQVLVHPFTVRRFTTGTAPPCPDGKHSCLQFSPHYSADGQLFYLAGIAAPGSPDRGAFPPCGRTCRYILTAAAGSRAISLTAATGENRNQASAWCTVTGPGNAAILTVPDRTGFATYRYANGHVIRLKYPVAWVTW